MHTRRELLERSIAAGGAGIVLTADSVSAASAGEFVRTDGTKLTVDGDPFYVNGTNNYRLVDPYAERKLVDRDMQLYADHDLNAVRTWGFCEGQSGRCLQPEPGVYSEPAFQHLDYVAYKARQHGIRLVLSLTDYWPYYGGMNQYVEWVAGASNRGEFYTNSEIRQLFKDYIETLLTRENTFTGVEYRNDPTIMLWELANEPRLKGEDLPGTTRDERLEIFQDWVVEMSSFIKSLAPDQLVTTGMEGFYAADPNDNWRYDGSHGTAYVDNHQVDTIDVCSIHCYPDHWNLTPEQATQWIHEHASDARNEITKPFLVGEFNLTTHAYSIDERNATLQEWYDAMDANDTDAALLWQFLSPETQSSDGYTVEPTDTETVSIIDEFTATQHQKSGPGGSSSEDPHAQVSVEAPVPAGAKAQFTGAYSFDPQQALSSYEWTFGDGTSASGEALSHAYDSAGEYDVTLTVTDATGNTDTETETVTVENLPEGSFVVQGGGEAFRGSTEQCHYASQQISGDTTLIAKLSGFDGWEKAAQAGLLIADDTTQDAPMGGICLTGMEGIEFLSSYGGGEIQRLRRTYEREEMKTAPIWLKVERNGQSVTGYYSEDGDSWTEFKSKQVQLGADVRVGMFVSSNSAGELATAQFDHVSGVSTVSGIDIGPVEQPGNTASGSGTGGGGDDPNDAPTAEIAASDTRVDVGDTVSLGAPNSSDPDGSIVSYEWAFGDGTTASGSTVTHSYESPGSYTVSLTVADDDGATAGDTITVDVMEGGGPPIPADLTVLDKTTTSIDLTWKRPENCETEIDHYTVYVDGTEIKQTASTATTVTDLSEDTTYQIGVTAVDAAGNESSLTTISAATEGSTDADQTLTDDCSDLTALASGSDTDVLEVDQSNVSYFEQPDGSTDGTRISRTGTTADASLVYAPDGPLVDGTVVFHWHRAEQGDIRVEESTDGGSTWQQASTTREQYGGEDGYWYHAELSIDFSDGANRARVVLTGGSSDWAGQISHVRLNYTDGHRS